MGLKWLRAIPLLSTGAILIFFFSGHEHADIELRHSSVGFMLFSTEITSVTLNNPPAVAPNFRWKDKELRDIAAGLPTNFVARFYSERHSEKLGRFEVTGEETYERHMDTIVLTELILLVREEYRRARNKCIIA